MNCEEVKISLHDFVDEELEGYLKRDVEIHIRTCDKCFNEYKKIRIFFDKLKDLPYLIEPPENFVNTFSTELLNRTIKDEKPESKPRAGELKKLKKEQSKQEKHLKKSRGALRKSFVSKTMIIPRNTFSRPLLGVNWSKFIFILLPLLLIALGYFLYDYQKYNSPWKVNTLEGTVTINGLLDNSGTISQGQSMLTNNLSRAAIRVPKVGNIEVGENSLIVLEKAKDGDNVVILRQGSINVVNNSNMPELSVGLGNCIVTDRGGEFNVSIDDKENARIFVKYGYVEIQKNQEIIYLNENYNCEIKFGFKIGTPYHEDASEALKEEVANFDYRNGGENSIEKIMELASERDMLTLLSLIPKSSQLKRQLLFQAIVNKYPPPETVTRMGIIKGDSQLLYLWWQEIEWQL